MKQLVRFIVVGVVNTALSYCVILSCMYIAKMSPETSNMAGYAFGLVVAYFLHRNFTFESTQRRIREMARFLVVFGVSYGLNFIVLVFLIHILQIDKLVSQILSGVAYVIVSFAMNKFYVFKLEKTNGDE
jgi:putative flippase GtrA